MAISERFLENPFKEVAGLPAMVQAEGTYADDYPMSSFS